MFGSFNHHEFMPCEECGMPVSAPERATHACDPERRAQYQAFQVRQDVSELDRELSEFFESPAGRFAAYYAERDRIRRAA